jgi:hypothetical protein
MTMTPGTEVYNVDIPPVVARGACYSDEELDTYLAGSISYILWDDEGMSNMESILSGITAAEFLGDELRRVLIDRPVNENWRVGESLAEAFLVEHRNCEFPWPTSRDLKNPGASPAGVDLVGFLKTDNPEKPHRFAFGEVKTSQQEAWPPAVVYNPHGLKDQLKELRDSKDIKHNLFRYLAHRAQGAEWLPRFRSSAERYLSDPSDVSLFGILVRDVEPKAKDLSKMAEELATACPAQTSIELRAIYLPLKTIGTLAERAERAKEGSHDVD